MGTIDRPKISREVTHWWTCLSAEQGQLLCLQFFLPPPTLPAGGHRLSLKVRAQNLFSGPVHLTCKMDTRALSNPIQTWLKRRTASSLAHKPGSLYTLLYILNWGMRASSYTQIALYAGRYGTCFCKGPIHIGRRLERELSSLVPKRWAQALDEIKYMQADGTIHPCKWVHSEGSPFLMVNFMQYKLFANFVFKQGSK